MLEPAPHAPPQPRRRVLILSAEEGEGHRAVARALEAELQAESAEVVVEDALQHVGRVIPFMSRDVYRVQLRCLTWTYGLECFFFARFPPGRAIARTGLALFGSKPLLRLIDRVKPDVIVSTHPAATSILGYFRRRGTLEIPVLATVSDFGIHPLWSHPWMDLNLVVHESCVRGVERVAGTGSARVVRPFVQEKFLEPMEQAVARRRLGLPEEGPLILVSGGGWGVGKLECAVRAALELEGSNVVCICGLNDQIRKRLERDFAGEPRARILGFTNDMNAAHGRGRRRRPFDRRCHVPRGTRARQADHRVRLSRRPCTLECEGDRAAGDGRRLPDVAAAHRGAPDRSVAAIGRDPQAQSAASGGAADPRRQEAERPPGLPAPPRSTAHRPRAGGDHSRPRGLDVRQRRAVPARRTDAAPAPGLDGSGRGNAGRVRRRGSGAPRSGGCRRAPRQRGACKLRGLRRPHGTPSPPALVLRGWNDPALPGKALPHWISVGRGGLRHNARDLGLGESFYYLVPQKGFSLGEYVVARAVGGRPVSPAIRFESGKPLPAKTPHARDVVVVTLGGSSLESSLEVVDRVLGVLSRASLSAVPFPIPPEPPLPPSDVANTDAPPTMNRMEAPSATRSHGSPLHVSPANTGARATGIRVVRPRTIGAT